MSTESIKKLTDSRIKAIGAARSILDLAKEESRSTTSEERASVQKALDEAASLGQQISDANTELRIDKLDDKYGERDEKNEWEWRKLLPTSTPPESTEERQLMEFFRGERAFLDIKPASYRALSAGTDAAGGHTVPEGFLNQLMDYREQYSGIRMAGVNVITTTGGEPMDIPHVLAQGTATLIAEGGSISGTDPTFQNRTLGAYKYAQIVNVTRELLQDNAVNLTGWLARDMGRALARATEDHYAVGTGTNQPQGIVPSASVGVTGAANTAGVGHPTMQNLISLKYNLDMLYHDAGAGWLMNHETLAAIVAITDDRGQYLWQPSMIVGEPERLLGFPVYTSPGVAVAGSAAKSVLFGNFPEAYIIRDAGGVRLERSDDFQFATDQVSFKAAIRTDGRGSYGKAIRAFVGGTS